MTFAVSGSCGVLATAFIASRLWLPLLFGVSRLDPATYAGVIRAADAGIGPGLSGPAWRATKVDPMALRYE